ncbi:M48 family metallopeptidase [Candidatus Lucifugimonas marina]|jgi:STE24 endopeptidase|uniref:M48 family metalloprotease n=1 Tax=Candidatus Lucifugimonas marina TaxID=3038979 RepID=A0AAJ5ZLM8_9CHLR|nr:M48 family metalloprotease [SAR202 cluster bacterium JH702]MDG0870625.1 M48 family metalloprotease [SAR202 cluster bacterium JH639]WFG36570.1 M48 family metalloprotease [SAR202 cluster bacterium JH545]WFG40503.1 M48 family metalloprotease [SAR202 cluster bacterium JH1073]
MTTLENDRPQPNSPETSKPTKPVAPVQARSYQRTKLNMTIISMALNVIVPLVFLLSGGSEAIRNLAEGWTTIAALVVVIYLLIAGIGLQIIEFPFEVYSGFVVEKKYDLSKVNITSWLYDWLKGTLLQSALLIALISGMYWLLRSQPDLWWLWAAIGATILVIILMALVPVLLLPLFYKFEPIPEGELKDRLFALADKIGTHVQGVYVWHLGDKTSKANAAVTGWGRTRRIIISDTLIDSNSIEEIEVVMAHELGHHVRWDVWKMLAVSTVLIFISFFVIDLALTAWIGSLGLRGIDDIAGLPLVLIVGAGVSLIALPISNWLSRKAETAADLYALNLTGMRDEFISAMDKLGDQNLSQKKPNPVVEFIFHSHPSIQRRIDNAKAWSQKK